MNPLAEPISISYYLAVGAVMFVTGAVMWWNRVLRKKFRRALGPQNNRDSDGPFL